MKHPMQPLVKDKNGTARFQENKIVRFLLEAGPFDMNKLAAMPFGSDDRMQFAQLIGYSVSGFGELPYANKKVVAAADALAEKKIKSKGQQ
jgi:hypothetical protein